MTGRFKIAPEHEALVISRVRPFLNTEGCAALSIERLLCEAYIQGLRDALDAAPPAAEEKK
jgi:hypothetical protein